MSELGEFLVASGVRSAVVIDDVFDDVPRADELDDDNWNVFVDDLSDADDRVIGERFAGYRSNNITELRTQDKFIEALWECRTLLSKDAHDALFLDYQKRNIRELRFLDELVAELRRLGLRCDTMGTHLRAEVMGADLLLVDLFLGLRQHDVDMALTIELVKRLVSEREQPPLVVLMSSSPYLDEYQNRFRDRAGLLGSTFRVVSKRDLSDPEYLGRVLRRLAAHYGDAKKIARFIRAWDRGVAAARNRFVGRLRCLDLSDLAQIRALMLEFEGQKLGDYMLDIADRVLQYETEAVKETIEAARELNDVDLEQYPAPHLTGTPDLQALVYRGMFFHTRRLGGPIRLKFGDLLRWNRRSEVVDVSLVVTPACDLARFPHKGIMLLCGIMEELTPDAWSYRQNPVRTPVVILPDGCWWIKWDLRAVKVVSFDRLMRSIEVSKSVSRIGRLRELHALELQQKMLASLGRVGIPANPPIAFPVQMSLHYVGTDSRLKNLDDFGVQQAVCYVGRDAGSRSVYRLVMRESVCDDVERCVGDLGDTDVVESARRSLSVVRDGRSFVDMLERGELSVPEEGGRAKPVHIDNQVVALVIRDQEFGEDSAIPANGRKVALIINVVDVEAADV